MSATENSFRDKLVNSLSQQLSEYELLKAMYDDAIAVTDSKVLDDITNFVDSTLESEYKPSHLDFVLNLSVEGLKLEISVNLPSFYPSEEPDLYVRSNQLNRYQETSLNTELSHYIKKNFVEEVCIYSAVLWLQDNVMKFSEQKIVKSENIEESTASKSPTVEKFVRLYIYSHHIYNKRKRDEIESRAKDLKLTGFCLPGKPGIICIEGPDSDCKEWWSIIKSMTWKKIGIKTSESFKISEQAKEQRFSKFEELHFPNSARNKHADMSGLFKYMEERGLSYIYKDLFDLGEI